MQQIRFRTLAQNPAEPIDTGRRPTPRFGRPDLVPEAVLAAMPAGGILHDYVCWAVQETYAPAVFHLGAVLPIWATTVARWGWTLPHRGRQVALQTFLIGAPASAKSTALRKALSFHEEFIGLWESDDTVRDWIEAEGTVPGILEHLSDMYDQERELTVAGLFHEEVGSLLGKGADLTDMLMQLFDQKPRVERALARYRQMAQQGQRPPSRVEKPAVSGLFCGTNSAMQRTLNAASFEGGLVSRSLWFTGRPDMERFFDTKPAPEDRREVRKRWIHLGRSLPERGLQGGGRIVRQTREGKAVLRWTLYPKAVEAEALDQEGFHASLQRGMNLSETIAGLYALSCGRTEISVDDMQRAVRLVEMSLETVEGLLATTADNETYRLMEKAEAAIKRAGFEGLTRNDLNRHHLRSDKGTVDQVVAMLEEERGIKALRRKPAGRGRPTTVFVAREFLEGTDNVIQFPGGGKEPPESE